MGCFIKTKWKWKKDTNPTTNTTHINMEQLNNQIQACVICFIGVVRWDVTVGRLLLLGGWMMRFVQNGQKGKNNLKKQNNIQTFFLSLCGTQPEVMLLPQWLLGPSDWTIRLEKNQYDIHFLSGPSDTFSAVWRQPETESNHGGAHNKNTWQTKPSVSCQVARFFF